jgi:hypothetical protein
VGCSPHHISGGAPQLGSGLATQCVGTSRLVVILPVILYTLIARMPHLLSTSTRALGSGGQSSQTDVRPVRLLALRDRVRGGVPSGGWTETGVRAAAPHSHRDHTARAGAGLGVPTSDVAWRVSQERQRF